MGLKVWLPLTKDLRQQGVSNINIINNGATYNSTDGKLGGSYSLDGTSINVGRPLSSPCTAFTICGWINLISGFTANYGFHLLSFGTTYGRICVSKDNAALQVLVPSNAAGTSGSPCPSTAANTTIVAGDWHHYAVTYNAGIVKIYIDGQIDKTYNTNITSFTYADDILIGTYKQEVCKGKINDYRIYDYALSDREIANIAKGLIVHFPLNHQNLGSSNLLRFSQVNAENKNLLKNNISSDWDKLTLTTKDGYTCYQYPTAQSSTWFASGRWYSNMKANTTYTYSAWIYFTTTANFHFTSLGHFQVYNAASTASDKAHEDVVSARIYQPSTIPANKWTKVRITFTTNDLADSSFAIYPRYNIAANVGDLYFRDCKLEENSQPTTWCPHINDNLYSQMGLDSNVEYDGSGFQNNGIKTGGFTWTSNNLNLYEVNTNFTTNSDITIPFSYTIGQKPLSIGCWHKILTGTTYNPVFCMGTSIAGITLRGNHLEYGNGSSNFDKTINSLLNNTTWHFTFFTYDGTNIKVYQDGVLLYTESGPAGGLGTINSIMLNKFWAGNACMALSDFRIYMTALSEKDIKSLYQNSAYIDDNNIIYGKIR